MQSNFRVIALAVAKADREHDLHLDTYAILNVASDVTTAVEASFIPYTPVANPTSVHNVLVHVAVRLDSVLYAISQRQKIVAIKALREFTGCRLIEAKRAIEDAQVTSASESEYPDLLDDPWGAGKMEDHYDRDEAPF